MRLHFFRNVIYQSVFTYCDFSVFASHRIKVSLYFNQNNFNENSGGAAGSGFRPKEERDGEIDREKWAGRRELRTLYCGPSIEVRLSNCNSPHNVVGHSIYLFVY